MRKPIDRRQNFLHFVADDVPAHFKGRPIQKLAMRLIRRARADRRVRVGPIDQRRNDHAATALGQPPGELRLGRDARRQSGQLFGRLIGIGNGDDVGHRPRVLGHQQQSFAVHAAHHRPANGKRLEMFAAPDQRRLRSRGHQLDGRDLRARVVGSDDLGQASPIRRDRRVVFFRRRDIALPVPRPLADRFGNLSQQEPVDAGDHLFGQIALHFQRLRAGQRFGPGPRTRKRQGTNDRE